jgi:ferrochelatase
LVAQLGTPDEPTAPALRRYLKQFLWDPRVIERNRAVWWAVLHGMVLRSRPERSAALYRRIWRQDGSPLRVFTNRQVELLRAGLEKAGLDVEIELGMRYGSPSLESAIDRLVERGVARLLLLPMYPQYSATTTAATYDVVFTHLLKRRWVPTLRVAAPYYIHPAYVRAVAATINDGYAAIPEKPEKLVLSYHGIPEAFVEKGDPYCCQCTETTRALLQELTIPPNEVIHTYQSRFGKDPWLVPYSDVTIENLAKSGVKRIAVACPGFTADCLETLDELGNEGRHLFLEHGGKELHLIPCLNDHPAWIEALLQIAKQELGNWASSNAGCGVSCPVKAEKTRQARS